MLRDRPQRFVPAVAALAVLAAAVFTGCEIDSASDNNLVLSPERVELRFGESQEFRVTGGFTYTWAVSQPEWGTLSSTTGERVTYTSRYDPGAEARQADQVLTVTSTLENEAGNTETNGFSIAHTRSAVITHRTEQVDVSVAPATATLQEFESVTFTASGALTYDWSLRRESWGVLTQREGATTTYTSLFSPADEEDIQELYCDTDEGRVTIYVIHEPEGLRITPTTASLNEGESVQLTAIGGADYNWSKSGTAGQYVTISPETGPQVTVTFVDSGFIGNQTVTVQVASGEDVAQTTITLFGTDQF